MFLINYNLCIPGLADVGLDPGFAEVGLDPDLAEVGLACSIGPESNWKKKFIEKEIFRIINSDSIRF